MTELHHSAGADWREPKFGEWLPIDTRPTDGGVVLFQVPEWRAGQAPSWLLPPTDTSIEQAAHERAVYLDWLDFNHMRDRAAWARWLTCDGYFQR